MVPLYLGCSEQQEFTVQVYTTTVAVLRTATVRKLGSSIHGRERHQTNPPYILLLVVGSALEEKYGTQHQIEIGRKGGRECLSEEIILFLSIL